MAFATTRKQSPSELCLAVMADGSLAFTREWPFTRRTMSRGSQVSPMSARSSLAELSLQQDRN